MENDPQSYGDQQRPKGPPPLGAENRPGFDPEEYAKECRKWIVGGLYYDHPLRVRDMSTNRRAEMFDQGAQNIQKAAAGYDSPGNLSTWVDTNWQARNPEAVYVPMPVLNEGLPARQNESARLERPRFKPVFKAKGSNPELSERKGAETMTNAVRHRLKEMNFDHQDALYHHRMPIHGAAWWMSELVIRYDKTRMVPSLTAVACPTKDCDFKLASSEITIQEARTLKLGAGQVEPVSRAGVRVMACPTCPDHPPLNTFQPTLEEAHTLKDAVDRPMGTEEPLADWEMSCPNDHEMFPADFGVGENPCDPDDFVYATVRKLDWVALRAPDKVGEVKPENAATLAKYHPVMGAPDIFQGMLAYKTFADSVRVVARHRKPWMECVMDERGNPVPGPNGKKQYRLNRGRSIVMAGNVVLLNKEYLFQSLTNKAKWIPRCIVRWEPWEFKDSGVRARGMSLWDNIYDAQITVNDTAGQEQAVRQTCAVPFYTLPKSANAEVKALGWGMPGALVTLETDPSEPPAEMKLVNNTTIDAGVRQEKSGMVEYIQRATHQSSMERGDPPPGVSAAVAMDSLLAATSVLREPRINRIKEAKKDCWKHGAEIIQAVYLEDREIRVEDEDGNENWQMVSSVDFASEVEVEVEAEPDVDQQARDIEVVRDMINTRQLDPAQLSPTQKRKLAKLQKAPEVLHEDEDLQTENAQREWLAFVGKKEKGKPETAFVRVPYVDPGLDDHSEHYVEHGRKAMSAHMRDLEDRAHWDAALQILATSWDETSYQVMTMPGPPCFQDRLFQTWKDALNKAAEMTEAGGMIDPETGQLAVDPSTGQPIPVVVKFTIDDEEALDAVLHWRSHMEAHKIADEQKQYQASLRATLAAPGAETTAAGNQVTEGAPPAETPPPTAPQPEMVQ
jgi:hypothetical protein